MATLRIASEIPSSRRILALRLSRLASTLALILCATTAILVSCTRQTTGTAIADPPPHVFPNLDNFTAVEAEKYYVPLRGGPTYQFVTASGVECTINLNGMGCHGNYPADPEKPNNKVCLSAIPKDQAKTHPPYTYTIEYSGGACSPSTVPSNLFLDVGKKLVADWGPTVGQFTCAVDAGELVACIDNDSNRGFVLQPGGSWTF